MLFLCLGFCCSIVVILSCCCGLFLVVGCWLLVVVVGCCCWLLLIVVVVVVGCCCCCCCFVDFSSVASPFLSRLRFAVFAALVAKCLCKLSKGRAYVLGEGQEGMPKGGQPKFCRVLS